MEQTCVTVVGRRFEIEGKTKPTDRVFTRRVKVKDRTVDVPVRSFGWAWQTAVMQAGLGHLICRRCNNHLDERARLNVEPLPRDLKCPTCGVQNSRRTAIVIGVRFHDLRRSFATHADQAGVPRDVIRRIAGWETESMFSRYRQFRDKESDAGVEKIEAYVAEQRAKATEAHKLGFTPDKLGSASAESQPSATARPN
jgi:integrase